MSQTERGTCCHQILKSTLEPMLKFISTNSVTCSKLLFGLFLVVGFWYFVWFFFLAAYSGRTLGKMEPGLSERMEISKVTVIGWAAELTKHN